MAKKETKRENIWLNIGFNIVAPSLLLIKGRSFAESAGYVHESLDAYIFVAALAFPIIYGVCDLISRGKWNIFSAIGILSVFLTGGIGLMKLSREWMIVKETCVPLVLGAAVLLTAATKKPLAKVLLMNEAVLDVGKIDSALDANGTRGDFEKSLKTATYILAASFLLSGVLNFALASYLFKSPAGTAEFNAEVGRMTALSFPVIVLPTMAVLIFAMFKLFSSITRCTGLSLEDVMAEKK